MALIDIYADSRGPGVCRSCKRTIEWAETVKNHKKMPFDDEVVAVRTYREPSTHRLIEVIDTTVSPCHFETCPQADDWRR